MDAARIPDADALTLARAIRAGEVSALQAFDAIADRVEVLNPALNALLHFDRRIGRAEAQAADRRRAAGDTAPLLGVPFTVKDNLWVEGQRVSQGSKRFADFVAPEDALAVARLRAAGAVFLGISACSEFACKGVTSSPLHGVTRHPYDDTLTPGGSSGGAAAAVAAGFGPIALVTDGGGSTRRPAAHTGVVGMKPSAGLVPHPTGFAEPVFGNAVVGQMARRVADVLAVLDAIAAPHAADPLSPPVPMWPQAADRRPLRIAASPRFGLDVPVDDDVAAGFDAALERLGCAGHHIEYADFVRPDGADEARLAVLQGAGLAALHGDALRRGEWDCDPDIAAQIEAGLRLTGVEVAQALFAREALHGAFERFFARHDLLLTPTTPCTAWPWSEPGPRTIGGQAVGPRGHAVFTPLVNHCHLSACSVPIGLDRRGLPIGLQIVGPRFADRRVLGLAAALETEIDTHCPHDFSRPHARAAAPTR